MKQKNTLRLERLNMKILIKNEEKEKKPTFGSIPTGTIFRLEGECCVFMKVGDLKNPEEFHSALDLSGGYIVWDYLKDKEVIIMKQTNTLIFERKR